MNKANNLDSFNSTSPLFRDLTDDQANQVSGGFLDYFTDSGSERHLGNIFNLNTQEITDLTKFAVPSRGQSR